MNHKFSNYLLNSSYNNPSFNSSFVHEKWPRMNSFYTILFKMSSSFTLFFSFAKSIRKSPIYERLHTLANRSSCTSMEMSLFYSPLNWLSSDIKTNPSEVGWQEEKSSRHCSPQINRVQIFNIQIIHKYVYLQGKNSNSLIFVYDIDILDNHLIYRHAHSSGKKKAIINPIQNQ